MKKGYKKTRTHAQREALKQKYKKRNQASDSRITNTSRVARSKNSSIHNNA